MKAAGLKAIDTVVESTAVLIKSRNTTNDQLVTLLAARIRGVIGTYPSSFLSTHPHLPVSPLIVPQYPSTIPSTKQKPQR